MKGRNRAEHHKAQNIKPKTPEEIAEMERKRRLRMEEEAAKWNMMEEDAPEEGEPVVEEEYDIGMEDVEDGEFVDIDEVSGKVKSNTAIHENVINLLIR